MPWRWCRDYRPVPMIAFHGTADRMAPYNGGESPIAPDLFPSTQVWTANWARRNHCATKPLESAVAADVTSREYTNCADDASVVFYILKGAGHSWPGGEPIPEWFVGPTSRSIDATSVMWAFFREHPLSRSESMTPRVKSP
jgi:polyhydroxybutyrate depolymerase